MSRPALDRRLSADDCLDYYWLKVDLVAFCREHALPVGGAKTVLVERVAAFLRDETVLQTPPARRPRAAVLPDVLSLNTVIGSGWRCGQQLRAFFVSEVGPSFRFNQALVGFVRDGEGRTLEEALEVWRAANEAGPQPLARQFEYNQHTRTYLEEHPEGTQAEARAAWWGKRSRRRSEWDEDAVREPGG